MNCSNSEKEVVENTTGGMEQVHGVIDSPVSSICHSSNSDLNFSQVSLLTTSQPELVNDIRSLQSVQLAQLFRSVEALHM